MYSSAGPVSNPAQPIMLCRPVAPGPLPGVPAASQTRKCPPSPCPTEPLARHASIVMGGVYPEPCRETVCPCDTLHRSYAPFSSGLTKSGFVCSYVPASVRIPPDACWAASGQESGRASLQGDLGGPQHPTPRPLRPTRVVMRASSRGGVDPRRHHSHDGERSPRPWQRRLHRCLAG